MINEKMREINADWAWTDTHQQMADGLTKVGARQQFADKLNARGEERPVLHRRQEDRAG